MSERTCTYYNRRRRLCCTECGKGLDLCQCVDPDELAFKRLTSSTGEFIQEVIHDLRVNDPPRDHLLERVLADLGSISLKLVTHDADRSIPESEIRRDLINLVSKLTHLAAIGTPEYAYPTD
jgi:hypothetical protein